jgi:hypothetical protein
MEMIIDTASGSKDVGAPVEDVTASSPQTPHSILDEAPEESSSKPRDKRRGLWLADKIAETRKAQEDKRMLKATACSGLGASSFLQPGNRGTPGSGSINTSNTARQSSQSQHRPNTNHPIRNNLQQQTNIPSSGNRAHAGLQRPSLGINQLIAIIDERLSILTQQSMAPVFPGTYHNSNFRQPIFDYMQQYGHQYQQHVWPAGNHCMVPGGVGSMVQYNGIDQYNDGFRHGWFAPSPVRAYLGRTASSLPRVSHFNQPYNPSSSVQYRPAAIPYHQYNQQMEHSQSSATHVGDSETLPLVTEPSITPKNVNLRLPMFATPLEMEYKHMGPPTPTSVSGDFNSEDVIRLTVINPAQSGGPMPVYESSNDVPRLLVGEHDWEDATKVQVMTEKTMGIGDLISPVVRSKTSPATSLAFVGPTSVAHLNVQMLT